MNLRECVALYNRTRQYIVAHSGITVTDNLWT